MADTIKTNLGPVTAYADAKAHGYTGTREEFGKLLAGAGQNLADAVSAKEAAESAAGAAGTSAQTAAGAANTACQAAGTAANAAEDARTSAGAAAQSAEAAETAKQSAEDAAKRALEAKTGADNALKDAGTAKEAASNYADAAADSATAAATSETNAANSASAAAGSAAAAAQTKAEVGTLGDEKKQALQDEGTAQQAAIEKKGQDTLATIPENYTQTVQEVSQLKEDLGNLNKEKLDSDVVYEVGDDGEAVSSTKMMDISGNGEIAKISADSVYKDNIIPLPNIAEKTVNGLTYSVEDGIVSLNGTATTYTLIDLGVNLSMMDGLSAIGYKIFVLDGTHPSGMSILLGISLGEYAQTLTNTVQEKKSSNLITFNNKNISISINNNTAANVKFGVVVIPINDIPSKFNVGKKYTGYTLNQLICTNNMWAFGTNISKIKLAQYYRFRKNKLYGKSLFVVGDSVAFGFGSGGKSYADIIAEKNKMSMKKVAVSGTTFAKRDGLTNSILEQVQTMDKMYDYVLIEGGFNDYFQKDKGVSIGTIPKNMNSSRDDKTTYGALDSICLWLKQNYPASKILFVVPHKIMTSTGVLDDGFYPYLQAIRNVCEKYSISYVDIALKGGCTPFYQEFRDTYFSGDGIHPNLEGYESFYVPRIEAEMEML